MESYQYDRIFNTCLQAEEFLREYPDGKYLFKPNLTLADRENDKDNYKSKLRKYKSNMAKLLVIFQEYKQQKYTSSYSLATKYDFYILIIMWMFGRANFHVSSIESSSDWYNIQRDAERFLKPQNGYIHVVNTWGRLVSKPAEPSDEQLAEVNERLDQFESILRASNEERLKQVVRLKLTMA